MLPSVVMGDALATTAPIPTAGGAAAADKAASHSFFMAEDRLRFFPLLILGMVRSGWGDEECEWVCV